MAGKWIALGGLALAAVAGGVWWRTSEVEPPPPPFRTAPVKRGDVIEAVSTTGTLQALTTVQVGTQVSGVLREILVDFNSVVTQGQVLARLETEVLEARMAQDEASLIAAEAAVERAKVAVEEAEAKEKRFATLYESRLVKIEELEAATFAVRAAKAALRSEETRVVQGQAAVRMARTNLGHATIKSPIDGVVVSRAVDVGQTVAASLQAPVLFTLAGDLRKMRVEANVDEADIGRITSGQSVSFTVDAYPERRFTGRVAQVRLASTLVQNVVTYTVVVHTDNPEGALLPGMTANVQVEVARADDALLIPTTALRFRPAGVTTAGERPKGPTVWTQKDGTPTPIAVEVGASDGESVAVQGEGLAEGLEVLTGGGATAPGGPNSPVNPMTLLRGGSGNREGGGREGRGGGGGGRRP